MIPALTLKTKMTVAVSLLVTGIALFIGFVNLFEFERHYKKIIADQQFLLISALANEIDEKLMTAQNSLIAVAHLITPAMLAERRQAQRFIDDRVGIASIFEGGLFLFDPAGNLIAHNTKYREIDGKNYAYRDYFKQALAAGKPVISEPLQALFPPYNPVIFFTAPILDPQGKMLAIFAGALDLTRDNFISKLAEIRIGDSGYLYLFNHDRMMIMHRDKKRAFKNNDVPPGANLLYDAALNGFEGSGETINSLGIPMLASFRSLNKNRWILAATNPQTQAYAPLAAARRQFYLLLSTVIAVAMALTWLLMKYLTAPLQAVIRHIAAMPAKYGESRFLQVKTQDEIAVLAQRFNQMIAELDQQMESARQLAIFKKVIEEDPGVEDVYLRLGGVFTELGFHNSLIYQISADQRQIRVVYPSGSDYQNLPCDDSRPDQRDAGESRPAAYASASRLFSRISPRLTAGAGGHCLPMIAGGQLAGIVRLSIDPAAMDSPETTSRITQAITQAECYIRESLPVIEAKQLLQQLRESVLTDALTGLRNRRFLQEYAENLIATMQRRQKNIGLIMCDLDYFKQINDHYGHDAGDRVLRETAQTIRKSIRDSDLLIRFGGEEFLVALLDIETGSTLEVGEKIRENVQNAPLMVGKVAIGQTISLGVSELPQDTRDFWQAIKFADLALYRAKALGRNRTVRFTGE